MIEPTDEMVAAFLAAWDHENRVINDSPGEYVETGARDRAGLAAVLAIVERDYQTVAICREELVRGLRCTRQLIPENGHRGDHEGKTSTGNKVTWS